MAIKCVKKGETHYLIEPTSKYVNVRQEEQEGKNCFVKDWVDQIGSIIKSLSDNNKEEDKPKKKKKSLFLDIADNFG